MLHLYFTGYTMAAELPFPIDRPELKLSNLEICFEIAKIKGLNVYEQFGSARIVVAEGDNYNFNPVEDKALCADLMEEFDVERLYQPYDCLGFNYHCISDKCIFLSFEPVVLLTWNTPHK